MEDVEGVVVGAADELEAFVDSVLLVVVDHELTVGYVLGHS